MIIEVEHPRYKKTLSQGNFSSATELLLFTLPYTIETELQLLKNIYMHIHRHIYVFIL